MWCRWRRVARAAGAAASFLSPSLTPLPPCARQADASLAPDAASFLPRFDRGWSSFCEASLTLRRVFTVLDTGYAAARHAPPAPPHVRPLWEACLGALRARLGHSGLEARAGRGLLALVDAERRGAPPQRPLLTSVSRALAALGSYGPAFEAPFLEASASFYAEEGARLAASLRVPEYLAAAEARLGEDSDRCGACFEAATRRKALLVAETALVATHAQALLDKGFADMMAHSRERAGDLARLSSLLSRVPDGPSQLRTALGGWARTTGAALMRDDHRDGGLVAALLELKSRADEALRGPFGGAQPLASALKDAFETFINSRANKPAELVAKFLDGALRAVRGTRQNECHLFLLHFFIRNLLFVSRRGARAPATRSWTRCWTACCRCSASSRARTCSRPSTRRT